MWRSCSFKLSAGFIWMVMPSLASADQVLVAVASNFTAPMQMIAAEFERDTGYQAKLSFGATGQFYAQINNGAPFEVLLAADTKTPAKLEDEGKTVSGTRFTYAIGKLVLWSRNASLVSDGPQVLSTDRFDRIAIANPKLAPYGLAAIQTIERLGLMQVLRPKMVQGANIGQAFQFVSSGNAQLGFVALSQVFTQGKIKEGSGWVVPSDYYAPIKQDAVLLKAGQHNEAAIALVNYLQTNKTKQLIESFGYQIAP
ncbi:molybdate ABC transporter substrate-binding protein [Orrella daihaiensis]|uniref:Molybdate ABC transporter substrate-binding protein n=1 Tax=Orrella daihaiensis TaxID=2782176 RepID=A0ABY4ALS0_9BURK|nr:molybdate ABC transporter substrate-binding protein [Orrella daihaiensis]UOD50993.1 molybdate ABC transporter substrate-binding protein [Orrella daihaiensis]